MYKLSGKCFRPHLWGTLSISAHSCIYAPTHRFRPHLWGTLSIYNTTYAKIGINRFPSPSLGNFIYIRIWWWQAEKKIVSVPISGELYLYFFFVRRHDLDNMFPSPSLGNFIYINYDFTYEQKQSFPSPSLGNFIYINTQASGRDIFTFPSPSLGNFIYIEIWRYNERRVCVSVPISGELYLYDTLYDEIYYEFGFRPHLWGTLSISWRTTRRNCKICFRPHLWGTLSICFIYHFHNFLSDGFRPHLWGTLSISK